MTLQYLLLMRHAKSSWSHDGSDHKRPLNARGQAAAVVIGNTLRARGYFPRDAETLTDRQKCEIWSSDAQRTRETAALVIGNQTSVQVEYLSNFYLAPANRVILACQERGEPNAHTLMLLGHNPGWESVFQYMSDIPRRFPSGTCAVFKRQQETTDWLDAESWRLVDFIRPKDIM